MAVTYNHRVADRIRLMSLHGLSQDIWNRAENSQWDYRIVAPGYKYNPTDIAAAIGIHQLKRVEAMRGERESISAAFCSVLDDVAELELPYDSTDRIHARHLFAIRLRLEKLSIDRNEFAAKLRQRGVGFSVHFRPLHLHPYYAENFGWKESQLPTASTQWERLISLPVFPGMRQEEQQHVTEVVRDLCNQYSIAGPPKSERRKPR